MKIITTIYFIKMAFKLQIFYLHESTLFLIMFLFVRKYICTR